MVVSDQQSLAVWKKRHEQARLEWWPRMQRRYHAKAYGPTKFSGPTVIVLDMHKRSIDPLLFSCIESYGAAVARADNTVASRLAEAVGGPIYDEKKAGQPQLSFGRRLSFLLQNGETVLLFPFNDIHNGELTTRVLKVVYNLEASGKISEVSYVPATVRYSGAYPLTGFTAHLRAFPSYRPFPFITRAEVFISDSPIKVALLPDENRSIDGLVSAIFKQARGLPEYYRSGQK